MFEPAIRTAKPCAARGSGKDFVLRDGNKMYFFIHDLAIGGHKNVTLDCGKSSVKTFVGVDGKVKSIKWMDNNQDLIYSQIKEGGILTLNAPNCEYGSHYVVRVAVAEID